MTFIAALVVAEAARLYARYRRWVPVLEELARGGNGTYARNTLKRRVLKYSSGQNSAQAWPAAPPAGARARAAKTEGSFRIKSARGVRPGYLELRHEFVPRAPRNNGRRRAAELAIWAVAFLWLFALAACGGAAGPELDAGDAGDVAAADVVTPPDNAGAGDVAASCSGCWDGSTCVPLEAQTIDRCGSAGDPCAPTALECGGRGQGSCAAGQAEAARHACHEPAGQTLITVVCCPVNVCTREECR